MKPAAFAYAKPRSIEEAVALLAAQAGARVLAGGQSLVATLNMRLDAPSLLVDINGIAGLDGIVLRNGAVEIGALVRHVDAERSGMIAVHAPLIALAMPHIGHPAIRNRGTLAGSIAFADPAAELPACLLALGGEVDIAGPAGARTVKADDFFKGLFETALGQGDLITAIRFSAATPATRVGFAELSRRHGDYAMVGLAAAARAEGAGLTDMRLAFFGVGATPVRARARRNRPCPGRDRCGPSRARGRGACGRSRSVRRHPGDRRREAAPGGRAAQAGRASARGAAGMTAHTITLTVNGEAVAETVEARKTLVDFLRDDLGLTGSHVGCEHGVCGACTVRVDGAVVRGCLMFAVQCDGARVETIEGVADSGQIADLQTAFETRNALQCGYCTPGMLLTAQELLNSAGVPSREAIRLHLSGNYCRCTGYQAIIDAIESVAQARNDKGR